MSRKSPILEVEEISGNKYPDLATAQMSTMKATVFDMAETIRALLASGTLIIQNGKIIPNPQG